MAHPDLKSVVAARHHRTAVSPSERAMVSREGEIVVTYGTNRKTAILLAFRRSGGTAVAVCHAFFVEAGDPTRLPPARVLAHEQGRHNLTLPRAVQR